jgi:hypothetical protein
VVLAAVIKNGSILELASEELKADKDDLQRPQQRVYVATAQAA